MIDKRDIIRQNFDNRGNTGGNEGRKSCEPLEAFIHGNPVKIGGQADGKYREKYPEAGGCSQPDADKCTQEIREIGNMI